MSNTNTNDVVDVVPVDGLPDGLPPEADVEFATEATEEITPKKKNVFARIIGVLLAVLFAVPLFLSVNVVKGTTVASDSLLNVLKELFKSETKVFGAIPALADVSTTLGKFAALALVVLIAMAALTFIFGVITVFCAKKAPALLRWTSFFAITGYFVYAVSTVAVSFRNDKLALDIINLALIGVPALVYLVLSFAKKGKKAWMSLLQCVLTLAVAAAVIYALAKYATLAEAGFDKLGLKAMANTVSLALMGVLVVSLVIAGIRMQIKKGLVIDLIRYILQFLASAVVCVVAIFSKAEDKMFLILAGVATVVSILQFIFCILQIKASKPKAETEEEVVEEPVVVEEEQQPEEEYVREEYAEALPYDGGPVEGVEVAEEVNPTVASEPASVPEVKTAGYDFYNSKSFDPFIALLNNTERNQFTELFILKYQGPMPELPDYQVGGDNKEFFRKLFIYLGQYRDRIPDSLLAKMYQFAIKM